MICPFELSQRDMVMHTRQHERILVTRRVNQQGLPFSTAENWLNVLHTSRRPTNTRSGLPELLKHCQAVLRLNRLRTSFVWNIHNDKQSKRILRRNAASLCRCQRIRQLANLPPATPRTVTDDCPPSSAPTISATITMITT